HARRPLAVGAVPGDRFGQPLGKIALGAPPELFADLSRVHRVAAVVAGAVGDVPDQAVVAAGQGEDGLHDVQVGAFVLGADVVHLAGSPAGQHPVDGVAVVVDVDPVAHLQAVAVDGQGTPLE